MVGLSLPYETQKQWKRTADVKLVIHAQMPIYRFISVDS